METGKSDTVKKALLFIYFLLRLPLCFAVRFLFALRKKKSSAISKILLIRLDRLGDFVTSLPVIDNLALAYPEAEIHILVRPYLKELAGMIKNIDKVIVYDDFFRAARQLRREHFDLAVDLLFDYKLKTALLAFLSAAPIRLGFAWGFREVLFSDSVKAQDVSGQSMVAVNLALLGQLDVPIRVSIPKIDITAKEKSGRALIVLHPGGNFASQRWNKDNFVSLAKKLLQKYLCNVLVIGGSGEQPLVNYIVSQSNDGRIKAVFLRLDELTGLLAGCDILICNNSGPLHLAAALGIPTVSMMGPTDPVLWQPQGERNIVIRKEFFCSPCSKAMCRTHQCMNLITVDEVLEKVKNHIENTERQG
jgi:lipopolysaccharide heptosyltransferase II